MAECTKNCVVVFHMTGGHHRTDCPAYGSAFSDPVGVMSTMQPDQVVKVCQEYALILKNMGAVPFKDTNPKTREGRLNHLAHMCNMVIVDVQGAHDDRDMWKPMRWLGFIQGAFDVLGIRSIDEMRDDNR